ncbi:MAG: hypothetical protein HY822_00930 [Acidobacteria bacterium]|nr:hypothetical protein [Acidobacteriota bacterium]
MGVLHAGGEVGVRVSAREFLLDAHPQGHHGVGLAELLFLLGGHFVGALDLEVGRRHHRFLGLGLQFVEAAGIAVVLRIHLLDVGLKLPLRVGIHGALAFQDRRAGDVVQAFALGFGLAQHHGAQPVGNLRIDRIDLQDLLERLHGRVVLLPCHGHPAERRVGQDFDVIALFFPGLFRHGGGLLGRGEGFLDIRQQALRRLLAGLELVRRGVVQCEDRHPVEALHVLRVGGDHFLGGGQHLRPLVQCLVGRQVKSQPLGLKVRGRVLVLPLVEQLQLLLGVGLLQD